MENDIAAHDGLTSIERETIMTYNNAEGEANVYTLNLAMRRKILQLATEYPDEVKILHQAEDMVEATVPKSWVKSGRLASSPMSSVKRWLNVVEHLPKNM